MGKQNLIFDLDDTLIHCNKYFRATINSFVNQIKDWFPFITREEITQKQLEIDIKSISEYGLNSSRFPESLVSVYIFYSEKHQHKIQQEKIDIVRKIGQQVFEIEVQPFPYMYEVLNDLQQEGHNLYMYTGGDKENQTRKIVQLELEAYFGKNVFIYEHKNTEALKEVLQMIKADPKTTWMIGNSLKTDIKPALENGIHAIHIPSELEWSYNNIKIDIEPKGELLTINSLIQLPEIFRKYDGCVGEQSMQKTMSQD
ncbi:HAD family hydrolase [Peribacillus glennii]|uniref:HAD family hydrolase n=1 Tax=Peribacillus glennii TaxID=2303991 RepID=A0A372LJT8_9BACI|nr:HAD family hydrolase [Peribacillus glennii]RFU66717.1 HAD family hydrolase [Peribacillus glennii]